MGGRLQGTVEEVIIKKATAHAEGAGCRSLEIFGTGQGRVSMPLIRSQDLASPKMVRGVGLGRFGSGSIKPSDDFHAVRVLNPVVGERKAGLDLAFREQRLMKKEISNQVFCATAGGALQEWPLGLVAGLESAQFYQVQTPP